MKINDNQLKSIKIYENQSNSNKIEMKVKKIRSEKINKTNVKLQQSTKKTINNHNSIDGPWPMPTR